MNANTLSFLSAHFLVLPITPLRQAFTEPASSAGGALALAEGDALDDKAAELDRMDRAIAKLIRARSDKLLDLQAVHKQQQQPSSPKE